MPGPEAGRPLEAEDGDGSPPSGLTHFGRKFILDPRGAMMVEVVDDERIGRVVDLAMERAERAMAVPAAVADAGRKLVGAEAPPIGDEPEPLH